MADEIELQGMPKYPSAQPIEGHGGGIKKIADKIKASRKKREDKQDTGKGSSKYSGED